ncbi:hypothetical protein AB0K92_29385 [Streptomyces sp. NPDC052687]|uniref:hypothetical protein n=1 Tax=Streptomyces sp. NPDC052687 TaxID=3154759 RepID=UPI00341683CF
MTWTLPEPMLTTAVNSPDLPPGSAAEPKRDGYRAQLAVYADRRVLLRSRRGTDMTPAFPEIRAAAVVDRAEQAVAGTGTSESAGERRPGRDPALGDER